MLLIRDIMYCKPGKVRPMAEKFLALAAIMRDQGASIRVLTDVVGERYWTVVAEMEVASMEAYLQMTNNDSNEETASIMEGYHDLIEHGRREVYAIEEPKA